MNKNRKYRKGKVTLVDILIVVLILAAISMIAIPRITRIAQIKTNAKAKMAETKANACYTNIDVINSAIEMYNNNTGSYPEVLSEVTGNTTYFPGGAPICPVIPGKKEYPESLLTGIDFPPAFCVVNDTDHEH